MEEGRVPAQRNNGLVEPETTEFAKPAGQTGPGAHRPIGLRYRKARRYAAEGIASDIAGDEAFAVVQLQGILNAP